MSVLKVVNLHFSNTNINDKALHMKVQETTFYEELQNCSELDLRDNRGKAHNLSFILLGLTLSLLSNRDGNLSSMHRFMTNKNKVLCNFLEVEIEQVVSRSHLPIVLSKVNVICFEQLLFKHYGLKLSRIERSWFAGDGKELRGSIESGNKRGEVLVQIVRQSDQQTFAQSHYNGTKESEIPCLRTLIKESGICSQKFTADALHLCPKTTEMITDSNGIFIIGLKGNQKELLEDMEHCTTYLPPINEAVTIDKGHGRLETRSYKDYNIEDEYFDTRWDKTAFKSLFVVQRERFNLKTKKESRETSYYISNGKVTQKEGYFEAIRKHWGVEVNNHLRDVTLKEDKLKTKKKEVSKVFAGIRTLVINLLKRLNPKSLIAQIEKFQDDFELLLITLRKYNFL